jgi:hypothetical protein
VTTRSASLAVQMPSKIRALPRDRMGRPIPWFVAELAGGIRDFRVADSAKRVSALRDKLCWVCGQNLPAKVTFALGPMCSINRITAEPPVHLECATYSAQACPFMIRPQMVRRTGGLENIPDLVDAPGIHIDRNPSGILLWTCRQFKLMRPPFGVPGVLVTVGDPVEVTWWTQGRAATAVEADGMLAAGYERLQQECVHDPDPAGARAQLARQYAVARRLLPAHETAAG